MYTNTAIFFQYYRLKPSGAIIRKMRFEPRKMVCINFSKLLMVDVSNKLYLEYVAQNKQGSGVIVRNRQKILVE